MSEETVDETSVPSLTFEISDPSIQSVYANDACAVVFDTDVVIAFGDGLKTETGAARTVARVVMSHAMFMRHVEYLVTRYEFLNTTLGGKPKTVNEEFAADPARVSEAYQKFIIGRDNPRFGNKSNDTT